MARLDRLLTKARSAAEKGKRDKALELYRDACSEAPHDPDLWIERAEMERRAGATAAAAESMFHAADLYARAGMATEAAGVADRVLAIDPKHSGAKRFVRMMSSRAPIREPEPDPAIPAVIAEPDPPPALRAEEPPSAPAPAPVPLVPVPVPVPVVSPASLYAGQIPESEEERPIGRVTGQIALGEISFAASMATNTAAIDVSLDDEQSKMVRAVAATISTSPLLSELDSDLVKHLIEGGSLVHVPAGKAVFQEGELGDSLFLVLEGTVDVERHDPETGVMGRLATLRKGAFFGEMALLTDTPRSATVRVIRDATMLEVSRDAIKKMIARDERVLKLLMRFFRARLVGTLMATSPLFAHLGAEERRDLVTRFRLRELPTGHPVLAQNEPGDGLYMVLAGELVAVRGDVGPEDEHELGRLHPGDVFGEMSLLEGRPAMATVRTATRSWVLRLPREEFERLARAHPQVLSRLQDIATARREANRNRIQVIEPV